MQRRRDIAAPTLALEPLLDSAPDRTRPMRRGHCGSCVVPGFGRTDGRHGHNSNEPVLPDSIGPDHPLIITGTITNTDRAFGTRIAGAIAERFGDAGLPEGSVRFAVSGSAGQSFGAFVLPGMSLTLVGDANDYVGKGMHGGEIVIRPQSSSQARPGQVIVGNSVLYGATGGSVFICGSAGERFAVRNSGATAIVEGIGDHGCEYMTGGTVVVLGAIGRNFAAGMSGGVAYVYDRQQLARRRDGDKLDDTREIAELGAADRVLLRDLLAYHERVTGSREAARILHDDDEWSSFRKLTPRSAKASDPAAPVAQAVLASSPAAVVG